MAKILITGGGGYIGSILVPNLLDQSHEVTVIDNFMYHQNSLAPYFINKNLKVIKSDVRDIDNFKKYLSQADILIPLAAIVGAPACAKNPFEATSINKNSVFELFRLTSKSQWIIMPTTNSAYGQSKGDAFLDEASPMQPLSLYAKDKVEVERELCERGNFTSFRLATVFGMSPRMRVDLLVNFMVKTALDPGYITLFEPLARRNYIHVRDVAKSFIYAVDNYSSFNNQIFNVGLSDANISKLDLANRIKAQVTNFIINTSEYQTDPDKRDYLISNKKIESTGFYCEISLDCGISELIDGLQTLKFTKYDNI